MTKHTITFGVALLLASCGNDNKAMVDAPTIHEGDAAIDSPMAPDCFTGTPMTHDQIINACPAPGVTRIFKYPVLPLMNSDGSMPPLP